MTDEPVSAPIQPPAAAAPPAHSSVYSPQAVHLVRTVTNANISLSQMADQKASLLMATTFLVFTISIGQAGRGRLPLPLDILAGFAFLSALLAIAAVLPAVRPPKAPTADSNILFFGVFAGMSEEDFVAAVLPRLTSEEQMFRTMLRDFYQNGRVLQRKKYRFLGYAYWTFLIGLTATFGAFLLERFAIL